MWTRCIMHLVDPPHPILRISHSGSKQWRTLLGIKISCSHWKAQGCIQGALLLFLLNFGRRGQGAGGGRVSFHFSLVPNVFPNIILQCVLSHFHLLKPLEPHPHPLPPSMKKIKILTRCSIGNGQWLEESSKHCPIFVHIDRHVQESTLNTKTTPYSHGFKIYRPGQIDRLTELIYMTSGKCNLWAMVSTWYKCTIQLMYHVDNWRDVNHYSTMSK